MLNDSMGQAAGDIDSPSEDAVAKARRQNMRLGLLLFASYLTLYTGFVLTSAFYPNSMEWRPLGGLNLALLWGFGLIIAAILFAFVYGVFSRVAHSENHQ
jgi:uncharacterized membrane protein (DUF485 family)